MTTGFYYPMLATWALSFLLYTLAGFLIWRRLISRTPHILLTVAGFMADFVAYFFQTQHLVMMAHADPTFTVDMALRSWQISATNLSMALYCMTAVFGFSRTVGWHKLGRLHLPAAATFILTLIGARILYIQLLG